jgi:hypothetical protein
MSNTLTLYRRHSHRAAGGHLEWFGEHGESRVFSARPHPVNVGAAACIMLVHEPEITKIASAQSSAHLWLKSAAGSGQRIGETVPSRGARSAQLDNRDACGSVATEAK